MKSRSKVMLTVFILSAIAFGSIQSLDMNIVSFDPAFGTQLSNDAQLERKPLYDGPINVPNPSVIRQGGDTFDNATYMPGIPYYNTGTTSGFTDDYDEICGFNTPGSPDVVYFILMPLDTFVTISLCYDDTDYDTKLYIYESDGTTVVDCNDDFCITNLGQMYVSELQCVPLLGGELYYIVVDGYGGNSGNYKISVEYCVLPEPCVLECPPGGIAEGEPCGTEINSGCNSDPPLYGTVLCGDTICGTAWANGYSRDTDWYEFTLSDTATITITGCANFPFILGIVDTSDCELAAGVNPNATGDPCDTITVSRLAGPGTYWVFAANQSSANINPCGTENDYWFTLQHNCPMDISLDHVDGLNSVGQILVNNPITFHLRARYLPIDGSSLVGFSQGFRVYSPDGALWQPITSDTVNSVWQSSFDLHEYDQAGVTGSGADSLGYGGIVSTPPGPLYSFDDIVWTITTQVDSDQVGKTLCIDSCHYPNEPASGWSWTSDGPIGTVLPQWSGRQCFALVCCEIRGDVDHTGSIDVADLTYLVAFLFNGGPNPPCKAEGDIDGSNSSVIDIADLSYLVAYLFRGGPPLPGC